MSYAANNIKKNSIYKSLLKNADKLKEILALDKVNLAEVDNLFRERNNLFEQLKTIISNKNMNEDELNLVKNVIEDNNTLIELMENKKINMKIEFKKKEMEAKKISSYLKKG